MDQRSLNSHKNKGHSPFFLPPIMRSSVGQCCNIRFRQLYASHVIITSEYGMLGSENEIVSLVMSLMASFLLSFFPRDVLDEIWALSQFLRIFLPTLVFPFETRNVTVCNECPRRSLLRDTPSHYALSFCDVSLNLLE